MLKAPMMIEQPENTVMISESKISIIKIIIIQIKAHKIMILRRFKCLSTNGHNILHQPTCNVTTTQVMVNSQHHTKEWLACMGSSHRAMLHLRSSHKVRLGSNSSCLHNSTFSSQFNNLLLSLSRMWVSSHSHKFSNWPCLSLKLWPQLNQQTRWPQISKSRSFHNKKSTKHQLNSHPRGSIHQSHSNLKKFGRANKSRLNSRPLLTMILKPRPIPRNHEALR